MKHAESRKLSEEHRREFESGKSIKELAEEHGLSNSAMTYRLKRAGAKMHRAGHDGFVPSTLLRALISVELFPAMKQMLESGKSLTFVGDHFGITRERMRQIASREGWKYRSMPQRSRLTGAGAAVECR